MHKLKLTLEHKQCNMCLKLFNVGRSGLIELHYTCPTCKDWLKTNEEVCKRIVRKGDD